MEDLIGAIPRLVGRLHPLIVHFPVGLLMVAGMLELWSLNRRAKTSELAHICLGIGALSALAAVGSGWLNGEFENHGGVEQVLFWHRWLGVALAAVASITWLVSGVERRRVSRNPDGSTAGLRRTYRVGLLTTVLLVSVGGHLGGVLVYGASYFTEVFEHDDSVSFDEFGPQFVDQVLPILQERCLKCHGPDKRKGHFRVDDPEQVRAHLDANSMDSIPSLVFEPDPEFRMPPEKEDPLTEKQLDAFREWLRVPKEKSEPSVGQMHPDEDPRLEIEMVFEAVAETGLHATWLSQAREAVQVGGGFGRVIGDEALDALVGLRDVLVQLDLSGAQVTDAGLLKIAGLTRLEVLKLGRTEIGDAGLAHLLTLVELRSLHLHQSRVTDASLPGLGALPKLERVYLWGSRVTEDGARGLREARPGLQVNLGSAPGG